MTGHRAAERCPVCGAAGTRARPSWLLPGWLAVSCAGCGWRDQVRLDPDAPATVPPWEVDPVFRQRGRTRRRGPKAAR